MGKFKCSNTSDSSVNRDQFTVLDVYKNDDALLKLEKSIDKANIIGCAFACLKQINEPPSNSKIGQRTTRRQVVERSKRANNQKKSLTLTLDDHDPLYCNALGIKVIGMSVSCSDGIVFYIPFVSDKGKLTGSVQENHFEHQYLNYVHVPTLIIIM